MKFRSPYFLSVISTALFSSLIMAQPWPPFEEIDKNQFQSVASLEKGELPLTFEFQQQCYQPQSAIKLNQSRSLIPCQANPPTLKIFRAGNYLAEIDQRSGTPTVKISLQKQPEAAPQSAICPKWSGNEVEIDVSSTFQEGEKVRDFYSGNIATVKNGKVSLQPSAVGNGLILLEEATSSHAKTKQFDWHNATVYFVLTDRFANGDPTNDHSYGRKNDGMEEIGTFHGGDLKGLTQKLDYLQHLGVNAIWISSPLEQMHGWVGGGEKGDFPHYAYHGYYHQDWTKIDANMGTEQDLKNFVEQAHQRGIRVLFDIVMNHTGYATLADMQEFGFGKLYFKNQAEIDRTLGKVWTDWTPKAGQNWHSFNDFINFGDKAAWQTWWGKDWVRSDIGDYDSPKFDDLRMSLASLPDLKTESEQKVKLPEFYQHKSTQAHNMPNAKVRDYLISWLSDWVKKYGIDGFRVDTAKHVELSTWQQLKQSANQALTQWQTQHSKTNFAQPFWMVGEAWGLGVNKTAYYDNGFDAMLNFDFQNQAKEALACFAKIDPIYQEMSQKLQHFNVLSYLSSHDTQLFFHSASQNAISPQKTAGSLLLLAPGAVQIFYGDESGRPFGTTGSDPVQGTRSDMNWQAINNDAKTQDLLKHWQTLAKFRQQHIAIGKGVHKNVSTEHYFAFSREYDKDKVMVVWVGEQ